MRQKTIVRLSVGMLALVTVAAGTLALIASPTTNAAGGYLPTVTPASDTDSANDRIVFLANDDGEYIKADGSQSFLDGGWDIYSVRLDGSDFQRLTDTPEDENDPVLSPDGTQIAFLRWAEGSTSPVFVMDVDGSNVRKLAGPDEQRSGMTWSPDSTRIAYNSRGNTRGVVVIDVASGEQTVIATMDYMIGYPQWSPDGARIAFTGHLNDTDDIWVINADGTDLTNVSDHPATEYGPYWFPDGDTLYFTRWGANGAEYYIAQADGAEDTALADRPVGAFAPDGARLVTVEHGDDIRELVIYDLDGTNPFTLLTTTHMLLAPRWASDGTQIVYFASETEQDDFHYDLYVVDAAGSDPRRLTYTNSAITGSGMFP